MQASAAGKIISHYHGVRAHRPDRQLLRIIGRRVGNRRGRALPAWAATTAELTFGNPATKIAGVTEGLTKYPNSRGGLVSNPPQDSILPHKAA
jgi:hypothetical protein